MTLKAHWRGKALARHQTSQNALRRTLEHAVGNELHELSLQLTGRGRTWTLTTPEVQPQTDHDLRCQIIREVHPLLTSSSTLHLARITQALNMKLPQPTITGAWVSALRKALVALSRRINRVGESQRGPTIFDGVGDELDRISIRLGCQPRGSGSKLTDDEMRRGLLRSVYDLAQLGPQRLFDEINLTCDQLAHFVDVYRNNYYPQSNEDLLATVIEVVEGKIWL